MSAQGPTACGWGAVDKRWKGDFDKFHESDQQLPVGYSALQWEPHTVVDQCSYRGW